MPGGSAGAVVATGTASAMRHAAANAAARTRFRPGTVRLLDKLPRPATRRDLMRRALLVMLLAASAATFVVAQGDKLDYPMLGSIRDEGLNRSQVMDHVSWLSDVYGPRLTGSPGLQHASEWAMKKFRESGQANVHQGAGAWRAGRSSGSPRTSSSRRSNRLSGSRRSGRRAPGTGHRRCVRVQIAKRPIWRNIAAKLRGTIVSPSRRGACACSKGRSSCG